ncbi:hypothetical protein NIES37_42210 [Tolypothrix tenuis PCC 7101]|uniref:Uncharacterized protein n=1 Tax=Tolypothrix tenuis PCC 7101 TaxID=231146 RepID=A0A1Z4N3K4_9CYAN|nr:hypothetical protein NIES2107_06520 [Nostoc carneum NIES-2107]BAZ00232.1 hypothetical protein NIES37_42210 [Tolypothrix tenuis PCC 7101]BAZ75847.1 hypothetical protein NIES50_44380 [Aulosira laxa NIES-50]
MAEDDPSSKPTPASERLLPNYDILRMLSPLSVVHKQPEKFLAKDGLKIHNSSTTLICLSSVLG